MCYRRGGEEVELGDGAQLIFPQINKGEKQHGAINCAALARRYKSSYRGSTIK